VSRQGGAAGNAINAAQLGLWRLMLKLPAIRGRLQMLAARPRRLDDLFEAFEEASRTLERLRKEGNLVLWTAGISGDTAVFGLPEVHINQSFGDILADIDFGFMAAGDARYGPFSIVTDIEYVRITSDAATPRGVLADEVDLKSVTFTAPVGAGYTVLEDPNGRLDVIGGPQGLVG
jgi:hypothetical protein